MNQRLLTYTFRLDRREKAVLRRAAKALHVTVAEFVRATVLGEAQSVVNGRNGAPYVPAARSLANQEAEATPRSPGLT